MPIFLFKPEQMLIGKLAKSAYKPFHPNDKILIEKNLKNLLGLKLLYSNYYDDDGNILADTIAVDKEGTICFIGYKKTLKDDVFKRYQKQIEAIKAHSFEFLQQAQQLARRDDLNMYRCKLILISSMYSHQEIEAAKNFEFPCELYTWSLVGDILIFDKVKSK